MNNMTQDWKENNIQQFLESTKEIELPDGAYLDLSDHNAKLINLVLEEVEKEVREKFICDTEEEQDVLSTIINNLRIK